MGDESAPACGVAAWSPAEEKIKVEGRGVDSCASYWIWPEGKPS